MRGVERRRDVLGGEPCLAGTRMPTSMVARIERNHPGTVPSLYPDIDQEQVRLAVRYERQWWRRVELWLEAVVWGAKCGWYAYREDREERLG